MKRPSSGRALVALILIGPAFWGCEAGITEPLDSPWAPVARLETLMIGVAGSMRYETTGFEVFPYQVRPGEGSGSRVWGELQLWVGFPPNPIFPPNPVIGEGPALVMRGVLHNPVGETLESGDFVFRSGPDGEAFEVRVAFDAPPNPCATLQMWGAVNLPNPGPPDIAYPSPGPPDVSLMTDVGMLVALPNPGPPGARYPDPGPPGRWYPSPGPPNDGYPNPAPPTTPETCIVGVQIGR